MTTDVSKFTFIDLFAGIGGFHQAAVLHGGNCVFACEIDYHAQCAYEANYGIKPFGDIRLLDAAIVPDHDVLFAGFPCQAFSIIGKMQGFEDTGGTLFFDIARILKQKMPPIVILENVKQFSTHDKGRTIQTVLNTLECLGYKASWKVLNALNYGLPQKRERTIIVGFLNHELEFNFPDSTGRGTLCDVLEADDDVDAKHFASEYIVNRRMEKHTSMNYPSIWHENKSGNVSSYPYSCALRAGASYNYLLVNGIRRLTPREMLRLQGFPDTFKIVCNDAQTRKQAGNAVPVNLVSAVLEEVIRTHGKTETQRQYRSQSV